MLTERLGHRKILGNHDVINNVVQFITITNKQITTYYEIPFRKNEAQWKRIRLRTL
jgi:hypothetical protein